MSRVQKERVMGGVGLFEYFWEQGLPVAIQKCLDGFHRRCIDSLGRQFIPKWDRTNAESVLTKAGLSYLLVELIGVAA